MNNSKKKMKPFQMHVTHEHVQFYQLRKILDRNHRDGRDASRRPFNYYVFVCWRAVNVLRVGDNPTELRSIILSFFFGENSQMISIGRLSRSAKNVRRPL